MPVVDILLLLKWDVKTAKEANLTGKIDDTVWVVYARKHNRISITFDELQKEQGIRISHELRRRGGKIIRLQGGPQQNTYRAIGKLLFHYPTWYTFFEKENNNGVCVISDIRQRCSTFTPEQYHQKFHPTDAEQFNQYLEKRKHKPFRPRKRKRKPAPIEQQPLT
ncbi:MAG: hypothetical protein ABR958_02815 [Dehalococcoidales bacterium]